MRRVLTGNPGYRGAKLSEPLIKVDGYPVERLSAGLSSPPNCSIKG
jgi:hypothetical protein